MPVVVEALVGWLVPSEFVCHLCVCLSVHAPKEKWLELSTPILTKPVNVSWQTLSP